MNKTEKIKRRKMLNKKFRLCPICPIRGSENARNLRNHGTQQPKYKDKR
jgi:hypothetical protein